MRDVEYLIRTLLQWEASLKLGVQELFLEGYRGTVMLNWERRNKKASVREIQQHTLITPLKSEEKKRKKTGTWFRFIFTLLITALIESKEQPICVVTPVADTKLQNSFFFKCTLKLFSYSDLTDWGNQYVIVTWNHQLSQRKYFFEIC